MYGYCCKYVIAAMKLIGRKRKCETANATYNPKTHPLSVILPILTSLVLGRGLLDIEADFF